MRVVQLECRKWPTAREGAASYVYGYKERRVYVMFKRKCVHAHTPTLPIRACQTHPWGHESP